MRIGMLVGGGPKTTIDDVVGQIRSAADDGFSAAWLSQIFGWDALTALAVAGREVPGIELGTAVIPTYPRHPMALAAQALTTSAATGGRLVLGIGLSHQIVIEGVLGYSFEKPARHMREYLSVLIPLLHAEQVQFEGETVTFRGMGPLEAPGAEPPPVLLAALAPRMLELAGSRADGTVSPPTGPCSTRRARPSPATWPSWATRTPCGRASSASSTPVGRSSPRPSSAVARRWTARAGY
jgi:F420-dependent oxidoreductase-like protein